MPTMQAALLAQGQVLCHRYDWRVTLTPDSSIRKPPSKAFVLTCLLSSSASTAATQASTVARLPSRAPSRCPELPSASSCSACSCRPALCVIAVSRRTRPAVRSFRIAVRHSAETSISRIGQVTMHAAQHCRQHSRCSSANRGVAPGNPDYKQPNLFKVYLYLHLLLEQKLYAPPHRCFSKSSCRRIITACRPVSSVLQASPGTESNCDLSVVFRSCEALRTGDSHESRQITAWLVDQRHFVPAPCPSREISFGVCRRSAGPA